MNLLIALLFYGLSSLSSEIPYASTSNWAYKCFYWAVSSCSIFLDKPKFDIITKCSIVEL